MSHHSYDTRLFWSRRTSETCNILNLNHRGDTPINQLGGIEFDRMIVEMFLNEFNLTGDK